MRRVKDQNLAELLNQLRFTPADKRAKQRAAAEKLLDIIEPEKEYPFEFVCYKITGFRPKRAQGQGSVKGRQLAEDLRIFLWKLAGLLARDVREAEEKVYTTERLAEQLGVSTKTIWRWRRKGLKVRKFVFEDGRKRLGFLASAVEEFVKENPGLVEGARDFSRISKKEKGRIIRMASKLTAETELSRYQIIERIARQMGRGHETIRTILLDYQKEHPRKAGALAQRPGALKPAETAEIYRLYRAGVGVAELMGRFGRSRSSVYRIIKHRRVKALLARRIEFIESPEFHEEGAAARILAGRGDEGDLLLPSATVPEKISGLSLSSYLNTIEEMPTLDRQTEMYLFRKYNFLKYLASAKRAEIKASAVASRLLDEIEDCLRQSEDIKRTLIEANLPLVVVVANKHTVTGANLLDLVSEGNVSLMRAVEKFDYRKGFRFATYVSWVIAKAFARRIPAEKSRPDRPRGARPIGLLKVFKTQTGRVVAVERARHDLISVIKQNLSEREQHVIINHFGLEGTVIRKNKKTLKQIGDDLDITKERVRQIELVALEKLRRLLSPEQFELLTG